MLKEKHKKELDSYPKFFCYNREQYERGMKELGLSIDDPDSAVCVYDAFYIRRIDLDDFKKTIKKHNEEIKSLIDEDKTGLGFIYDMFKYAFEQTDFEYSGTGYDVIEYLGFEVEEVRNNAALRCGFLEAGKCFVKD